MVVLLTEFKLFEPSRPPGGPKGEGEVEADPQGCQEALQKVKKLDYVSETSTFVKKA